MAAPEDTLKFPEHLKEVLGHMPPCYPPKRQVIGSCAVGWEEIEPGRVMVIATGGTLDERVLAEWGVRHQLAANGFRQYTFAIDDETMRKTAKWADIMAKAKRLIMSGQVTLLRNGYHNIVAHVIGDHGEYNVEISREDPDSRVITQWQCECGLPGTRIVMADGTTKAIEEVRQGDFVMTATGRAGKVGRTMSREYEGEAVGLRMTGSTETIWVTANHKLPDADGNAVEAKDWVEGQFSYMPMPLYNDQTEIDTQHYLADWDLIEDDGWLYKRNKDYGSNRQNLKVRPTTPGSKLQRPIPTRIPLDDNFARLAGLFVAEGMVTPKGELRWSFGPDEEHLAEEVIERLKIYGLRGTKKFARSCLTVSASSRLFGDLFVALFGTGARGKRLASQIMAMPIDALQVFFDAWFEGDGHEGQGYRNFLGTASEDLAMQARVILARLQRESVIRVKEANVSELVPGGGDFRAITWRRNGGRGHGSRFFAYDQVYQRMEKPERKAYKGPVYNFEVEGEHTYVFAPGIASFNCPWSHYAWGRTREFKKFEGRVCSHTLAAFWKALGTPLDEALNEDQAANMGPGQRIGPGAGTPLPPQAPSTPPEQPDQTSFGPQGESMPQGPGQGQLLDPTQMADATGGPPMPSSPDVIPPYPGQALEQMQEWQGPGTTPGGGVSPPGAVSVPGAKPPSPFNPMQWPGGTYSMWVTTATQYNPGDPIVLTEEEYGQPEGKGATGFRNIPAGSPGEVVAQDPTTGWVEVIIELTGGAMTPYHCRLFVEPTSIKPTGGRSTFERRRR